MSKFLVSLLIACACSCSDKSNDRCEDIENREARKQCVDQRDAGATPAPTPLPSPTPKTYTIEYRVIGDVRQADITYVSDIYGSNDILTGLPWFASFKTSNNRVFVSLSALANSDGVLRVQILVDGVLFREGSTDGFFGSSVEVSGTIQSPITQVRK